VGSIERSAREAIAATGNDTDVALSGPGFFTVRTGANAVRYTRDGGYATHTIADAHFCFPLGETGDDAEIAPWLCAGLVGWRSYRMAGDTEALAKAADAVGPQTSGGPKALNLM